MIKKRVDSYIINRNIEDDKIPETTKVCFNILKSSYGINARMSDIIQLLEKTLNIKFELFDTYTWNPADFLSYLLDVQINFSKGEDIDLAVLHSDLLKVYQFTLEEKKLFIELDVEERLWSILLIVADSSRELFNIFNNNNQYD